MWSVFIDMIVLAVRALLVPQADNRACDDVTIPRQITCGYQRPPWSVDDLEFSLDIRVIWFGLHSPSFPILFQIPVRQLDAGSFTGLCLH